jgi:RNA binding exosome subunit
MRKIFCFAIMFSLVFLFSVSSAQVDTLLKGVKLPAKQGSSDQTTIASGLKEALTLGTGNAVTSVSKTDGYFGNKMIKILMPEKIQTAANALGKLGYQKQVDDFVFSMNRAAEKAAPKAKEIFVDAIKQMTIDDAKKILNGGNTAATDYFKSKTSKKIFDTFKPIVSSSMNEVGATKAYNDMMGKYTSSVPFAKKESLDLNTYVTNKASDGLFYVVGQEEKKIRTDPAARVTDLLKNVFGK